MAAENPAVEGPALLDLAVEDLAAEDPTAKDLAARDLPAEHSPGSVVPDLSEASAVVPPSTPCARSPSADSTDDDPRSPSRESEPEWFAKFRHRTLTG